MRKETFMKIQSAYQNALYNSFEIVEAIENFILNLREIETNDELEQRQIGEYISQLKRSKQERENTDSITNLTDNIALSAKYFTEWYNSTVNDEEKIFMADNSRVKAFESELKKLFERTINGTITPIKDRFGCEIVISPNRKKKDEASVVSNMYRLCNMLLDCFCGNNQKLKDSFLDWLEMQYQSDNHDVISRIKDIMSIDFYPDDDTKTKDTGYSGSSIYIPPKSEIYKVYKSVVKDYCLTPKTNSYQAVHFALIVPPFTKGNLAGLYIEFQLKTSEMFNRANNKKSPASHDNHKDSTKKLKGTSLTVDDVLYIDDWNLVPMIHFNNSLGPRGDRIGLRYPVTTTTYYVSK